jgi:hypothetical protein
MPILEIMGRRVEVGDEFTALSPEAQQSTVNEIASQFAPPPAPAGKPVAIGKGEKQAESDLAMLKEAGYSPAAQTAQAAAIPALNAALFNVPSHAIAAKTYLTGKEPSYTKVYEKQKEYEDALARQNPYASGAGTAVGIVGGLLVPGGALARGAQAAKAAAQARGFGTGATKAAELAGAGASAGALTGISSGIESLDPAKAARDAALGAGLGAGVHYGLGKIMPGAVKGASPDELQGLIDQTVGKGKLTAQDIPGLEELVKAKGASPAVIREALAPGAPLSTVAGKAAPASAKEISDQATQQAREGLAAQAEKMAGTAPAEDVIGEALHRKITEAKPAVRAEYSKLAEMGKGATFDKSVPSNFIKTINPMLLEKQISSGSEELSRSGLDQAARAMKYIEEGIAVDNLPLKDLATGVAMRDVANYEAVRKRLKGFQNNAKREDRLATSIILDGFDEVYNNALKNALTKEGDPDIGKKLTEQLTKAREASKDFHQRFTAKYGTSSPEFMRVVNQMVDQSTGQIADNIPIGSASAAQKVLTGSIMQPLLGEAMYVRLENALGKNTPEMAAVTQQIRNHVLTPEVGKDVSSLAGRIDKFLAYNPRVAERVFSGVGEQPSISDLRRLSEGIKIIAASKKPEAEKQSEYIAFLKGAARLVGAASGATAFGPVTGAAISIAEMLGSKATGALRSGSQQAKELAGAPITKESFDAAQVTGRLKPAPFFNETEKEPGYQDPRPLTINGPGNRMGRKAGGRVSDRLIREVERAKKSINSNTESLLNTPDSHVAHALEIANRNLEG